MPGLKRERIERILDAQVLEDTPRRAPAAFDQFADCTQMPAFALVGAQ